MNGGRTEPVWIDDPDEDPDRTAEFQRGEMKTPRDFIQERIWWMAASNPARRAMLIEESITADFNGLLRACRRRRARSLGGERSRGASPVSDDRLELARELAAVPIVTAVRFRHSGEVVVGELGESHPHIVQRAGYQLRGWKALVDRLFVDRASGEVIKPSEAARRYLDFFDGHACSSLFFAKYER
jgi:hypothetical protein